MAAVLEEARPGKAALSSQGLSLRRVEGHPLAGPQHPGDNPSLLEGARVVELLLLLPNHFSRVRLRATP